MVKELNSDKITDKTVITLCKKCKGSGIHFKWHGDDVKPIPCPRCEGTGEEDEEWNA